MSLVDKPKSKQLTAESDLSQILAHGPAFREAYGPYIGAIIMLFTVNKARRGAAGLAALGSIALTILYHVVWK